MIFAQQISTLIEQTKPDLIEWRRYLHQNPELSFSEINTSQYVYDLLSSFEGLELTRPTPTSVMARLRGPKPGKTLAIRADMDALPITEETELEFASKNSGIMHACGHDGHTAMLLGAAKILSQFQQHLQGEVRFLFQHAEELFPGGASQMVEAGVMQGVDAVLGIHLRSLMEVGKIGISAGPINAAPDTFDITVIGKGGHAAYPHQTVDSVAIAAQVVNNLQHVVSRNADPLDPLVLTVTQIIGGTAYNVIPGATHLKGTVRSYNPELRVSVPEFMERIVKGVTAAHGATYEFSYEKGYHPVVNDEAVTTFVRNTLLEVFGEESIIKTTPTMGGEDFSAFQLQAPGTFIIVGAGNPAKGILYPHHHSRFVIDEDALPIGTTAFVHLALKMLEKEFE